MKNRAFEVSLHTRLVNIVVVLMALLGLSGCSFMSSESDDESKAIPYNGKVVGGKISIIPIIYPDRVVELDPRTGKERLVPDSDLIVENGKVWGRYLRLGRDVEYIMSYHNQLCAPALTVDMDTIGESSRPVRSFSVPEPKYDDCKEEEMERAAKRIQAFQSSGKR